MLNRNFVVVMVCLIGIFTSSVLYSQETSIKNAFDFYANEKLKNSYNDLFFLTRKSLEKKVVGNPYLKDWEKAFLIDKDSNVFSVRARYRIFDDEFQILVNNEPKALYPNLIKGITFENQAFVALKRKTEDGLIYSYFELLVEGELTLLKRIIPLTKNKKDYVMITGQSSEYYYQQGNEIAYKLPNANAELKEFFISRKGNYMATYIEEQSSDLSKSSSLISLFQYYNLKN